MLARRLTTILPAMTLAEAIETTRIHRVAGLTSDPTALVTTHPFRAPHHTISDAGRIGGGHIPMPGEVWLAHEGFLLLDGSGSVCTILSFSYGGHSRRTSWEYHHAGIIDRTALARSRHGS